MEFRTPTELADFLIENQIVDRAFVHDLPALAERFDSVESLASELCRLGKLTPYQKSELLSGQGKALIFGPYRLIQKLGEGGMGKVFKAWHARLDRLVALKFVRLENPETRALAIGRFHRESRAIAHLQHPNIVLLYDADEIDGMPYIAMEFVDGVSLTEMVRTNGQLGVQQACEYMRQAALGLQHALECGLVHRDIKPSNLVVSRKKTVPTPAKGLSLVTVGDRNRLASADGRNDTVKILDMGLALLKHSLQSERSATVLTEPGAMVGTPDFIAPEQARDARDVDIRTDLYSLGCTFYYLLSARFPFPGESAIEKVLHHQLDQPTALKALRPNIPPVVADIVERLMAKRPVDRFQTPQALVDALTNYLATPGSESSTSIKALPPNSASQSLSTARVRALETTEEVVVPAVEPTFPKTSRAEGVDELKNRRDRPGCDGQFEEIGEHLKSMQKVGKRPPSPETAVIAKRSAHDGIVCSIAVSADGRYAATGDVNGRVRIWDLDGAEPHDVADLRRHTEIQAIAFNPNDADMIIVGELRKGKAALLRWNWSSNSRADFDDIAALDQSSLGCLSFTNDGEMLAAGLGLLAVTWKVDGGVATNRKIHKGQATPIRALAISPDHQMLTTVGQHDSLRFWELGKRSWNQSSGVEAKSPTSSITIMCYSPDGKLLAMAGVDPDIVLWDMAGSETASVRVLKGHTSNVVHCQFVGDSGKLASVCSNGQVIFWDVRRETISQQFNLALNLAYRVALSADATRLVAGYSNGTVAFCNLRSALPAACRK
jgi:serine/threonine protein kinase